MNRCEYVNINNPLNAAHHDEGWTDRFFTILSLHDCRQANTGFSEHEPDFGNVRGYSATSWQEKGI